MGAVGLIRDIGMDLFRTEKLAKDINKRKLLNIVILYLVIILLFICDGLVFYFKFCKK